MRICLSILLFVISLFGEGAHLFDSRSSYNGSDWDLRAHYRYLYRGESYHLSQEGLYQLRYNTLREQRIQDLSFPGEISRLGNGRRYGLMWEPRFFAYERIAIDDRYGMLAINSGPVYRDTIFGIPLFAKGGFSLDFWHDDLESPWINSSRKGSESDHGGFFEMRLGGAEPLFDSIPLWGEGYVEGRYMSHRANSKMTSGGVHLSYRESNRFGADSVKIYWCDTLLNGRPGSVGGYSGELSSTPQIIHNRMGAGFSLLGMGDRSLQPSLFFDYGFRRYRYPNDDLRLSSQREESFSPRLYLDYPILSGERGDLLWDGEISLAFSSLRGFYEYTQREWLDRGLLREDYNAVRLGDRSIFNPKSTQHLHFKGSGVISMSTSFSIEREQVLHPFRDEVGGDTIRSENDRDKLLVQNSFTLKVLEGAPLSYRLSLYRGEETLHYLRGGMSASSYIQRPYTAEIQLRRLYGEGSSGDLQIGGSAIERIALFSDDSHRRQFFGAISGEHLFSSSLGLNHMIRLSHFDAGMRDGRNYGVDREGRTISYRLMANLDLQGVRLGGGLADGRYGWDSFWDSESEGFSDRNRFYSVVPALTGATALGERGRLATSLRYTFQSESHIDNYWDFSLQFQMGWP